MQWTFLFACKVLYTFFHSSLGTWNYSKQILIRAIVHCILDWEDHSTRWAMAAVLRVWWITDAFIWWYVSVWYRAQNITLSSDRPRGPWWKSKHDFSSMVFPIRIHAYDLDFPELTSFNFDWTQRVIPKLVWKMFVVARRKWLTVEGHCRAGRNQHLSN